MSRTLQQRIIKSKATFPVTVVLALSLWLVGVQCPLTEEIPLTGWWGTLNLPVWIMEVGNLLVFLFDLFLMSGLNNAYSLVRHRSTLQTSFFLLLWTALPAFRHSLGGNLLFVCLIWSIFFLFRSYQSTLPVGEVAHLFFFIGVSSLIQCHIIWIIPLIYITLYIFKALSPRTFCAGLVGFLLPYWFLFAYTFCTDKMELFYAPWQSFHHLSVGGYSTVSLPNWLLMGYIALLFLYGGGYVLMNGHSYKIRTRLFLLFLLWWSFFGLLLWILIPSAWGVLATIPILGISLLSGHAFGHSSTWASNILFLLALILMISLSVYHCLWLR